METDYLKNEDTFKQNVEKEAASFRPPGECVFSYTRPATHVISGKGKHKASSDGVLRNGGAPLDPDSADVSTFETYHVSFFSSFPVSCLSARSVLNAKSRC